MRVPLVALAIGLLLPALGLAAPGAARAGPVKVLELFQSQGCSSCPPANANLNALAGRSDVIALSYGVTYWDYLGWADSFARPAYTARQRAYARSLRNANVYTPQMVLNGRADFVGASAREVEAALGAARPLPGTLIGVAAGKAWARPGVPAELLLVTYDPAERMVAVRRGENGGRTLPHRNIVTAIVRLGAADGVARALPPAQPGEARVLLLQAAGTGPLLDAVRL